MNGVHDMGGMTCFGPVVREENEPIFHAPWERRVFALGMSSMGNLGTLDEFRHAGERMDPAHYLAAPYYEHWLAAMETLAVEKGILTREELASGQTTEMNLGTRPPLPPEAVPIVVQKGVPCDRREGRLKPRFKAGDRVTARNLNPSGHTRLPRYVRGKQGVIDRAHGTFVYPDTNAHGGGERPQPLYSVRFSARELWGPAAGRGQLYIDLWEDYLTPVPPQAGTKPTAKATKPTAPRVAKAAQPRRTTKTPERAVKAKAAGRTVKKQAAKGKTSAARRAAKKPKAG
jgi:nitrile hydratase beta subunit